MLHFCAIWRFFFQLLRVSWWKQYGAATLYLKHWMLPSNVVYTATEICFLNDCRTDKLSFSPTGHELIKNVTSSSSLMLHWTVWSSAGLCSESNFLIWLAVTFSLSTFREAINTLQPEETNESGWYFCVDLKSLIFPTSRNFLGTNIKCRNPWMQQTKSIDWNQCMNPLQWTS